MALYKLTLFTYLLNQSWTTCLNPPLLITSTMTR